MGELLQHLQDVVLAASGAWWIYPAVVLFCLVDGFFPPVPSESVVIALAVAAATGDDPNLWLLLGAAVVGAWSGDQIAYQLGRWVGTERIRLLRGPRGRRAVAWARYALERRGATFILAARYVPVGRVAVNMSAGALRYPRRRFMAVSGLAAVFWGICSVVVGLASAAWLGEQPLLAMGVGVVVGLLLGLAIDRVVTAVWARRAAHAAVVEATADAADAPVVATAAGGTLVR
jgi:membrane protein DedA with SNARE-associated domain